MERCHSIFVLKQERIQKTEMMQHAGVWFQFRVKGYDDVCEIIWRKHETKQNELRNEMRLRNARNGWNRVPIEFRRGDQGWESLIKLHKTWGRGSSLCRVVSGTCYSEEMTTRSRNLGVSSPASPSSFETTDEHRKWMILTNAWNGFEEGSPESDSTVYGTFDAKSNSPVFHCRKTADKSRLQNNRVKQMAGDE